MFVKYLMWQGAAIGLCVVFVFLCELVRLCYRWRNHRELRRIGLESLAEAEQRERSRT
jgi:hypothetical protein